MQDDLAVVNISRHIRRKARCIETDTSGICTIGNHEREFYRCGLLIHAPYSFDRLQSLMNTILDVAKQAGVSAMTVSRYFNQPDMLAPATHGKVRAAIEELQYVPNAAARSLVNGCTNAIALILSDITNSFYTTVARGVEDRAQQHGYTLILGNSDESLEKERRYLDVLISRRVDGVLISSAPGNDHHLDMLLHHGIPVVLIDRTVEEIDTDAVWGDTFTGALHLTSHLVEQGFRDIALVGGWPGVSSLEERQAGYLRAMKEAGLVSHVYPGRTSRQSGEEITEQLFRKNLLPQAIIAANNHVAVGVLLTLRRHGLRVPEDVALACFDDIEIAAQINPFLTVVAQPAYEMGTLAMDLLLERMRGFDGPSRHCALPTKMIVRCSSLAPGA